MISNGAVTIYHRALDPVTRLDAYARQVIPAAFWEDVTAAASGKDSTPDDSVRIYVEIRRMASVVVSLDDIIAQGAVTSEIGSGYTITQLQRDHHCMRVKHIARHTGGSPQLQHVEIGGE